MGVFVALLCILILLWLAWRKQKTSIFKNLGYPGPEPNLLFGNILELYWKGPLRCHKEWVEKYGRVLVYYYGMKPVLLITDPQLLKNIFIKDFSKFMDRETMNPINQYNPTDKNSQSVVNLPGKAWKDIRRILTPSFTNAKMKQMAGSMKLSIETMLEILHDQASNGEEVDMFDVYQRLSLDVMTRTAFGMGTDVQTNRNSDVLRNSKLFFSTPYRSFFLFVGLSFPLLRRFSRRSLLFTWRFYNYGKHPHTTLCTGLSQVLEHRRKNPQKKAFDCFQVMVDSCNTPLNAGLDLSKPESEKFGNEKNIENKHKKTDSDKPMRKITSDEIIASALTMLLAGYQNTSAALAFTTYFLAENQDIQETLFQEIQKLVQSGQKLEFETVYKLPYLDKVLCESMRIYPPVNLFTNRYAVEDVQYGDFKIPKGTLIQAPVYLMHHDPEFWTDPETFDPERFNTRPNSDGITYLPFGVGPRNCLGMRFAQLEAKLAIAHAVHKFRFTLPQNKKDLQLGVRMRTLAPEKDVYLKLERRAVQNTI